VWGFGNVLLGFFLCNWEKNLIFTLSPRYWQSIIDQPGDILVPNLTIRDDQMQWRLSPAYFNLIPLLAYNSFRPTYGFITRIYFITHSQFSFQLLFHSYFLPQPHFKPISKNPIFSSISRRSSIQILFGRSWLIFITVPNILNRISLINASFSFRNVSITLIILSLKLQRSIQWYVFRVIIRVLPHKASVSTQYNFSKQLNPESFPFCVWKLICFYLFCFAHLLSHFFF
jgi:hypothetical protein